MEEPKITAGLPTRERGGSRVMPQAEEVSNSSPKFLDYKRYDFFQRNKRMEAENIFALVALIITCFSVNRLDSASLNELDNAQTCEAILDIVYVVVTILIVAVGLCSIAVILMLNWVGYGILAKDTSSRQKGISEFDGFWDGTNTRRIGARRGVLIITLIYVLSMCLNPQFWCNDKWWRGLCALLILLLAWIIFLLVVQDFLPCRRKRFPCCKPARVRPRKDSSSTRPRSRSDSERRNKNLDQYWRNTQMELSSTRSDEEPIVSKKHRPRQNRARQSIELNVNQNQMITIRAAADYHSPSIEIFDPKVPQRRMSLENIYEIEEPEEHRQEFRERPQETEPLPTRHITSGGYPIAEKTAKLKRIRPSRVRDSVEVQQNLDRQSVEINFGHIKQIREPINAKTVRTVYVSDQRGFDKRYDNNDKRYENNEKRYENTEKRKTNTKPNNGNKRPLRQAKKKIDYERKKNGIPKKKQRPEPNQGAPIDQPRQKKVVKRSQNNPNIGRQHGERAERPINDRTEREHHERADRQHSDRSGRQHSDRSERQNSDRSGRQHSDRSKHKDDEIHGRKSSGDSFQRSRSASDRQRSKSKSRSDKGPRQDGGWYEGNGSPPPGGQVRKEKLTRKDYPSSRNSSSPDSDVNTVRVVEFQANQFRGDKQKVDRPNRKVKKEQGALNGKRPFKNPDERLSKKKKVENEGPRRAKKGTRHKKGKMSIDITVNSPIISEGTSDQGTGTEDTEEESESSWDVEATPTESKAGWDDEQIDEDGSKSISEDEDSPSWSGSSDNEEKISPDDTPKAKMSKGTNLKSNYKEMRLKLKQRKQQDPSAANTDDIKFVRSDSKSTIADSDYGIKKPHHIKDYSFNLPRDSMSAMDYFKDRSGKPVMKQMKHNNTSKRPIKEKKKLRKPQLFEHGSLKHKGPSSNLTTENLENHGESRGASLSMILLSKNHHNHTTSIPTHTVNRPSESNKSLSRQSEIDDTSSEGTMDPPGFDRRRLVEVSTKSQKSTNSPQTIVENESVSWGESTPPPTPDESNQPEIDEKKVLERKVRDGMDFFHHDGNGLAPLIEMPGEMSRTSMGSTNMSVQSSLMSHYDDDDQSLSGANREKSPSSKKGGR